MKKEMTPEERAEHEYRRRFLPKNKKHWGVEKNDIPVFDRTEFGRGMRRMFTNP